MAKAKIRKVQIVDIDSLKGTDKTFVVKINNKETELQIGDKLHFPVTCPYLKTVIQISIFEDKSVNYVLKWYDGNSFQQEIVSVNDLKLLNLNVMPRSVVGLEGELAGENDSSKEEQ